MVKTLSSSTRCARLFDEFAPASPYEEQLTHQVVNLLWRLRRIPEFEAALLTWIDYQRGELSDGG